MIKTVVLTYKLVLQYIEYKHCGIMLCPSVYVVMVNHKCVLFIGWSIYTEIIVKVICVYITNYLHFFQYVFKFLTP